MHIFKTRDLSKILPVALLPGLQQNSAICTKNDLHHLDFYEDALRWLYNKYILGSCRAYYVKKKYLQTGSSTRTCSQLSFELLRIASHPAILRSQEHR